MRLCLIVFLLIFASSQGLQSAFAQHTAAHPTLGPKEVIHLIDWIASKTSWNTKTSPTISFTSPAQLHEMYFGNAGGQNSGITVRALYEKRAQAIYLSSTWNPNNIRDRSYLVHELVHHLQFMNNVEVACDSAYNIKAYQLQFDWLSEQGVRDPQSFVGVGDVLLLSSTQCPLFDACQFLPEGCPK